ncbi:MAG: hypothetical protein DI556_02570 [Rhodovulum sulfidophilum]|uniref:Uncharacterized protein n=1 Tax=Rhodovulum sulfidophilum TaxID=35806 RepID=A0A2W5NGB1_RHOSU|nr:MAG: hypothetical protein DI556_02570 [Rhodovulum sulfidophilum]
MRRLFLATTALVAATAAQAQDLAPPPDADIASASECEAAIKANPALAREQAARWSRLGGGTEARLCEAAALEALGADATAAQLLTGLAQNPNRAMGADLRATTYEDAARLWLRLDRPDLARDALLSANRLTEPEPARFVDLARAEAGLGNWAAARDALDQALALDPGDAGAIALRAATLRHLDDPAAALADARRALALAPDQPEALFEEGAALATQGDTEAAAAAWTRLIEAHPDSDLAAPARRNLQRLSAAAPEPMPQPREQPGPRPRPGVPPRG